MPTSMQKTVLVFNAYGMGQTADADLKLILARKFLALIAQADTLPDQICFYTDGVRLCVTGSPVLDELRALQDRGVELVLCSTCLDRFGLASEVQAGIIGGMGDIITSMVHADKVVTL